MATVIPANEARFSAEDLAVAAEGVLRRARDGRAQVMGVVTDSRAVIPGSAFVALRGDAADGHEFLSAAIERGAAAVVIERGRTVPPGDVAVIEVADTLSAFGRIGRAHLRRWRSAREPRGRVVAITGSAGKTTTKDLTARILGAAGPTLATTGNLNNRIGLPAVALSARDEAFAVLELGMSVPGEISALAQIAEADVAVLLNIGVAHAEGFGGSRAGIAREKGAIFEHLSPAGVAVVNLDDAAARAEAGRTSAARVGFGLSAEADVRLLRREPSGRGTRITIDRRGRQLEIELPVAGEAVALDLLAAIAAADAAAGRELPAASIAAAVASWQPPAGRATVVELAGDVWALDDSYNANPASMRAAFATAAELRRAGRRRLVAVLGEMRELGPLSEEEHEGLGAELARCGFDLVIGCGGAIDLALRRAEALGIPVRRAAHASEAGAVLVSEVRAGDLVIFKGSRGATVERALEALLAHNPPGPRAGGAS